MSFGIASLAWSIDSAAYENNEINDKSTIVHQFGIFISITVELALLRVDF